MMPRNFLILPAVGLGLVLAGCSAKPKVSEESGEQTVTTAALARVAMAGGLTASGRLVPREEVAVSADLNGYRVARVMVEEGAFVRRGQVLAQLDDSLLASSIDQLQAQTLQQQVGAEQARTQAERVTGLENQGVISDEAIQTRKMAVRSTSAALEATKAQLRDLKMRRAHLAIRAPSDGVVLERNVRPGDPSSTGATMFRMARDGLIEMYAELTEADAAGMHLGDAAEVVLPSGRKLVGNIRLIGARVDAQSGLVVARIRLPRDPELRAGGYAQARFTGAANVLAVPEAAVHFDADGASLKLVDAQSRIHRVAVRTGRRAGGLVEIVSGPPVGSLVAVKGSAFTLEGDKVRVAQAGKGLAK